MQNIMLNKTQNKLPTHSDRFNGEFLTRKNPPAKRPTRNDPPANRLSCERVLPRKDPTPKQQGDVSAPLEIGDIIQRCIL